MAGSEAYPADSLDLDAFWNGGAEAVDFHDIPVVDRPYFGDMKQFIDNEGEFFHPPRLLERVGRLSGHINELRHAPRVKCLWFDGI